MKLPLSEIVVGPELLRGLDAEVDTSDIEPSIRAYGGVYQPVLVRRMPGGEWRLVAGYRRLLASKRVGLDSIAVQDADHMDDRAALRAELVENAARKDIPAHRYAQGVLTLLGMELAEQGMDFPEDEVRRRLWRLANERKTPSLPREVSGTVFADIVEEVFGLLGKSALHFAVNILPALSWPEDIRGAMERGLSRSAARTLAQIEKPELRNQARELVESGEMTAPQARAKVLSEAAQTGALERDLAAGEVLEVKAERRVVDGYLTPPPVFEWPEPSGLDVLPWAEGVPELLARFTRPGGRVLMMLPDVEDVDLAYSLGAAVASVSPEPRFQGEGRTPAPVAPDLTVLYWRPDFADRLGAASVDLEALWASLRSLPGTRVVVVPFGEGRRFLESAPRQAAGIYPLGVLVRPSGEASVMWTSRQLSVTSQA